MRQSVAKSFGKTLSTLGSHMSFSAGHKSGTSSMSHMSFSAGHRSGTSMSGVTGGRRGSIHGREVSISTLEMVSFRSKHKKEKSGEFHENPMQRKELAKAMANKEV